MKLVEKEDFGSKFYSSRGFSLYNHKLKNSTENAREFLSFFQERADLEKKYAHGLVKLSKKFKSSFENESREMISVWDDILASVEKEAKCHFDLLDSLNTEVITKLEALNVELANSKKPVESFLEKSTQHMVSCRKQELKDRKRAFKLMNKTANLLTNQPETPTSKFQCTPERKPSFNQAQRSKMILKDSNSNGLSPLPPEKRSIRSASLNRKAFCNGGTASLVRNIPDISEKWKAFTSQAVSEYFQSFVKSEEVRLQWHIDFELSLDKIRQLHRSYYQGFYTSTGTYTQKIIECLGVNYTKKVINESFNSLGDYTEPPSITASCTEEMKKLDCHIFEDIKRSTARNIDHMERYHDKMLSNHELMMKKSENGVSHDNEQVRLMFFGMSRQILIDVPDEEFINDPLYTSNEKELIDRKESRALQPAQDRIKTRSASFLRSNSKLRFVSQNQRQLISKFYNENYTHLLKLLVDQITKDRNTKQGLVNLLSVYESQPFFSDSKNLFETRKSLFISHNRLQHLTFSLRKLLSTLKDNHDLLQRIQNEMDRSSGSILTWKTLMQNDLRQASFNRHALLSRDLTNGPLLRWIPIDKEVDYTCEKELFDKIFIDLAEMKQEHILTPFEECLIKKASTLLPEQLFNQAVMEETKLGWQILRLESGDTSSSLTDDLISKTDEDLIIDSDFDSDFERADEPENPRSKGKDKSPESSGPCFEFIDALQVDCKENGFEDNQPEREKRLKTPFFRRSKLKSPMRNRASQSEVKSTNVTEKTLENLDIKDSPFGAHKKTKSISIFSKLSRSLKSQEDRSGNPSSQQGAPPAEANSLVESVTMPSISGYPTSDSNSSPDSTNSKSTDKENLNSIIGWARITKTFSVQGEICKTGDIVTLLSKINANSWFGIMNGLRLECPADCLEEF